MRRHSLLAALTVLMPLGAAVSQTDSTWRDHDRAARQARQRGDWRESLAHTQRVDSLVNGHPRVAFAIARAQVHLGDTAAAVASLQRVADMGLTDLLADSEFVAIRAVYPQLALRLRDNAKASGSLSIAAVMPEDDLIAEGIAFDAKRRRLLVTSIRRGSWCRSTSEGVWGLRRSRAGWRLVRLRARGGRDA